MDIAGEMSTARTPISKISEVWYKKSTFSKVGIRLVM